MKDKLNVRFKYSQKRNKSKKNIIFSIVVFVIVVFSIVAFSNNETLNLFFDIMEVDIFVQQKKDRKQDKNEKIKRKKIVKAKIKLRQQKKRIYLQILNCEISFYLYNIDNKNCIFNVFKLKIFISKRFFISKFIVAIIVNLTSNNFVKTKRIDAKIKEYINYLIFQTSDKRENFFVVEDFFEDISFDLFLIYNFRNNNQTETIKS